MISIVRIPLLLSPIFALAHHLPDITPEKFKDVVYDRLAEKDSCFIVDKLDGQIRGFLFCTVDKFQGNKVYVIQHAYVNPKAEGAGFELMARACQEAKELGLCDIYMMTTRNPEPFIRKYKFEHSKYILKRSI